MMEGRKVKGGRKEDSTVNLVSNKPGRMEEQSEPLETKCYSGSGGPLDLEIYILVIINP